MGTDDFRFELPPELIAQGPAARRDQSRLLVLDRQQQTRRHCRFRDLSHFLRAGDVLVLNDSRVIPARLRAVTMPAGSDIEVLLLEENIANDWWAMTRPGKRAPVGTMLVCKDRTGSLTDCTGTVVDANVEGHRRLRFTGSINILERLDRLGDVPLPSYIKREDFRALKEDWERYQTVYARAAGSVAAPTAGLHFTPELLDEVRVAGVRVCTVTLHVGRGTFAPVRVADMRQHVMHEERFHIPTETAAAIAEAKTAQRRVIAVGTTTVRVLETVALMENEIVPMAGRTSTFIHPPYSFRVVDALVTNFHLPCSTLLMLVSAFAAPGETRGREMILSTYMEAVRERYRFFSYGDAMLLL